MRRDALEERTGRPDMARSFVRFGVLAAGMNAIANAIADPERIIRE